MSREDRALCDFAAKLTLRPGTMEAPDIEQLRQVGFTEGAVTIAIQVIGYFNYINRIGEAVGVAPESWMTLPPQEWKARKGRDYG